MASPYFYPHGPQWHEDMNNYQMAAFNDTQNIPEIAHVTINDQIFVNRWLSMIKPPTNMTKNTMSFPSALQMKQFFKETLDLCEKIEEKERIMREQIQSLSGDTWNRHLSEIGQLKNDIREKEVLLKNDGVLHLLKKRLSKRLGKRERLKRRKAELRKQKEKGDQSREIENTRINLWMKNMQDKLLNKKRDENMKFETDMILRDVIKRKTEATKYLSLLDALRKLRIAKEKSAIGRGENLDTGETVIFNNNLDKLATLWTKALEKYLSEERNLKEKLVKEFVGEVVKDTAEAINAKENNAEEIISLWKENLFGRIDALPQRNFHGNIETFVANRAQWDQYLWISNGGSQMPNGWVIPPVMPTDKWKVYQH